MKIFKQCCLILTIFLAVSGCFVQSLPDPFAEQREKRLDDLINKNERLKRLNDLCQDIGSSNRLRLVRRSVAKDDSELYFYFKAGIPYVQISNNLAAYFREKAWTRQDHSRVASAEFFRKDGLAVTIQYGGIGGGIDLGVTCTTYLDSSRP